MERKGVSAESMQKSHTNLEGSPAFFRLNPRSLKCFWLCCPPISSSSAFFGGIDLLPVFTRAIERCFFRDPAFFGLRSEGEWEPLFRLTLSCSWPQNFL